MWFVVVVLWHGVGLLAVVIGRGEWCCRIWERVALGLALCCLPGRLLPPARHWPQWTGVDDGETRPFTGPTVSPSRRATQLGKGGELEW